MKKTLASSLIFTVLLSSCVSRRLYNELNGKYEDCASNLNRIQEEFIAESQRANNLDNQNQRLTTQLDQEKKELADLKVRHETLTKNFKNLEQNSAAAIQAEIARLNKLQNDLDQKAKRVTDLEGKLNKQNEKLNQLKNTLSKALFEFEGKGLTVEQKNGKVYVSMENKLLFNSGSWAISPSGRDAVQQLGQVLANNPDISILIEGHTDNDRIFGTLAEGVTNNWDLSTKRATAIVSILEENPNIVRKNITAAGRSQYAPIASNETADGKAKNRRIEVILTPRLDEISKMLNEIQ